MTFNARYYNVNARPGYPRPALPSHAKPGSQAEPAATTPTATSRTASQLPPAAPAVVAHIKASHPGGRYSCGALGACQEHDPCCLLAPLVSPDSAVDEDVSLTAMETVATWALFLIFAALTIVVTLGCAGYLYGVWGAA